MVVLLVKTLEEYSFHVCRVLHDCRRNVTRKGTIIKGTEVESENEDSDWTGNRQEGLGLLRRRLTT